MTKYSAGRDEIRKSMNSNSMDSEKKERKKSRTVYESLMIAFAMYSRIPVSQVEWTAEGMKYALCFFPLIGVVMGGVMVGFDWAAQKVALGKIAYACIGTGLPVLLTGGIHMDGFLDVVDARSSCQPAKRKLEIMKDPHTGAFAILGCSVYLLLYLAAFSELKEKAFPAVAGIYVLERALSGWSVVSWPKARAEGLVSTFAKGAQTRVVQISMIVWGMAAGFFLFCIGGWLVGLFTVSAAVVIFIWYHRMILREFGGITGDLAGYFLQLCELGMLGALAVVC